MARVGIEEVRDGKREQQPFELGEATLSDRIAFGIPDVLGEQRGRYAGRRVAVVGSGHSAQNVVRDLAALASEAGATTITWLMRRPEAGQMFGGGMDRSTVSRASTAPAAELLSLR